MPMPLSPIERYRPVAAHPPTVMTLVDLRLAVAHCQNLARLLPEHPTHHDLEDHRTEAVCVLLEALDRIDPGLGSRMLHALYPGIAATEHALADRRAAVQPQPRAGA